MIEHPDQTNNEREERIRLLAYRLWEEEGHPEGKAEEHWQKASAIIFAEENSLTVPGWLKKADDRAAATPEAKEAPAVEAKESALVLKRSRAI